MCSSTHTLKGTKPCSISVSVQGVVSLVVLGVRGVCGVLRIVGELPRSPPQGAGDARFDAAGQQPPQMAGYGHSPAVACCQVHHPGEFESIVGKVAVGFCGADSFQFGDVSAALPVEVAKRWAAAVFVVAAVGDHGGQFVTAGD